MNFNIKIKYQYNKIIFIKNKKTYIITNFKNYIVYKLLFQVQT
jgi:hypothetical protein